jgi:hypothetical protein
VNKNEWLRCSSVIGVSVYDEMCRDKLSRLDLDGDYGSGNASTQMVLLRLTV